MSDYTNWVEQTARVVRLAAALRTAAIEIAHPWRTADEWRSRALRECNAALADLGDVLTVEERQWVERLRDEVTQDYYDGVASARGLSALLTILDRLAPPVKP